MVSALLHIPQTAGWKRFFPARERLTRTRAFG
jgi:hypothetical protein